MIVGLCLEVLYPVQHADKIRMIRHLQHKELFDRNVLGLINEHMPSQVELTMDYLLNDDEFSKKEPEIRNLLLDAQPAINKPTISISIRSHGVNNLISFICFN